ncbi:MAG: PorV/PorQ family protein [Candidatus Neomarinimicrobiota bacterium]|nr:PorV/PorQ family protein [Candidatus Neomarinimicrobiota bacterium]|tara:strand:- start:4002 stop:4940 length:939 start_codon:yes stop_codon:yes gene_type:complete
MKKISKLIFITSLISGIIFAQDDFKRVGKSGFGFLKISPSARAAGMGDAFTAIADDVTTIFYNPAGLTNLDKFVFNFNHTDWIVNSSIISGAIAKPFGRNGAIGLSIVKFDTEDFEETTVLDPEGTGRMIDAGDVALALAYAIQLTDNLSFGFKGQYLEEKIDIDKATAITADFSTYYRTGFRDLTLAMIMKNFGPEAKFLSDKFKLPLYFNVNTAMSLIGSKGSPFQWLVSVESAFATDYRDRYHLGTEMWIADMIALRGGYKFYYDTEDWTIGAGLKVGIGSRKVIIDISYSNFVEYFDPPLRFSIGGSF